MAHRERVTVVGVGLAGAAAALACARAGVAAVAYERRTGERGALHQTALLAELVGSNDLGPDRTDRASGLLRAELRELLPGMCDCLEQARLCDGQLLVSRDRFARCVTEAVQAQAGIELRRAEVRALPTEGVVVVASGPTTWSPLARGIHSAAGVPFRFAFRGRTPLLAGEALAAGQAQWLAPYPGAQPRLFVPLSEQEAEELGRRVAEGERAELPGLSEAALADEAEPVERVVRDDPGRFRTQALRAPRGSTAFPADRPALRLRPDGNANRYHVEDFVTALTPEAQAAAFEAVTGLRGASLERPALIARLPHLAGTGALLPSLQMAQTPTVLVAGALAGTLGYLEALATGCVAGINAARLARGDEPLVPPAASMTGGLCRALAGPPGQTAGMIGAGFGLVPEGPAQEGLAKAERRQWQVSRAEEVIREFAADIR